MVTQSDVQGWAGGLDAVLDRIGSQFKRAEPRRRAAAYLRGLLAHAERKNGWQLAEAVGDVTPDDVQDFLSRAQQDADAVRDDLQAYAAKQFGEAGAVLVLDETGFLRKGAKSAWDAAAIHGHSRVAETRSVCGRDRKCPGRRVSRLREPARPRSDRPCALFAQGMGRGRGSTLGRAHSGERRICHEASEILRICAEKLGLAMVERARTMGAPFSWTTSDSV